MKNLKANAVEIATEIAKAEKELHRVEVAIWNGKRLYVNYPEESSAYKDGGYIDLKTGYIKKPAYKERTRRDKLHNAIITKVAASIFE